MQLKKWTIVGAAVTAVAVVAAFAIVVLTPPLRVFRTTASMTAVGQGTNSISGHPEFDYAFLNGSNLVALALGANPTSNQVFAMEIDCGSQVASLLVFDKSNSNITTIATSSSIDTVRQQGLKSHFVNSERFVAQFAVNSVGNLAGGFLTVAGRLNLDTNGCPHAVTIALDRDTHDTQLGDQAVVNTEQDGKSKDTALKTQRAGRAHFIGVLDVVGGGETNTVLIPLGRMTFLRQLDEFSVE
jgi:hypothetical protein